MKVLRSLILICFMIFAGNTIAAESGGDLSYLDPIINMVIGLVGTKLAGVMVVLYFCGVIFKPLFSFLNVAVKATTWTVKDDTILAAIMESKIYKIIAYVLDVIVRIKLPTKDK